jgi:hypothetical protein
LSAAGADAWTPGAGSLGCRHSSPQPRRSTHARRPNGRPPQVGVNSYQAYAFIREFTDRPMEVLEAAAGCAAKAVLDLDAGLVVLASRDAEYVRFVCKYRPRVSCWRGDGSETPQPASSNPPFARRPAALAAGSRKSAAQRPSNREPSKCQSARQYRALTGPGPIRRPPPSPTPQRCPSW